MAAEKCEIGLIGLGVMGRNFVLNMADHGFAVAAYNRTTEKTRTFVQQQVEGRSIRPGYTVQEFIGLLRRPRTIIVMVTAGSPVDAVIAELLPHLEKGDLVIDSGNSRFTDTDRRIKAFAEKGLLYLGMGVSGGELGARFGPSIMPGGHKEGWERVKPVMEAAAAQVNGEPCVAYLGKGSAGHYVKMVHNGIEYGIEQLIAETYDIMKQGLGFDNDELHKVYAAWNREEPASYLMEITSKIFLQNDPETGKRTVDVILDVAKQKGTGIWTSQEAMDLRIPAPVIDTAVSMRCLSELKGERRLAENLLRGDSPVIAREPGAFVRKLKNAFFAAAIVTYSQGMAVLARASKVHGYDLNPEAVARIWRGGCIIRAALLEEIRAAFQEKTDLSNLLLDPHLGGQVTERQSDWRDVLAAAVQAGIPVPGLSAALAYFDAYRRARLPANLTQAQRDFFGAHTYERVDAKGTFHTEWDQG